MIESTPFSLVFQWEPPSTPNGPIMDYMLTVDYDNGTNETFSVGVVLSYTLNGLSPYQLVTADISASTVEGSGPSSNITTRTLQDSEYCIQLCYLYSTMVTLCLLIHSSWSCNKPFS